ncbi:peptidoglycan editing factor PgeF [Rhodocyclaceae bacterium SMB388]
MSATGFIRPVWEAPTNVHALVTTRAGGVSRSPYEFLNLGLHVGDDPEAVQENRALVRSHLPAEPVWLEQVHGTVVAELDHVMAGDAPPMADAAVARRTGVVCAVMSADCLPVILCDDAGSVVAAAHAGWRGLAAGVLETTVDRMGVAPGRLRAWLGPAIGPDAFEVGDEVRDRFISGDPDLGVAFRPAGAPGKWMADLYQLARNRLQNVGVERVGGGGWCTFSDAGRFYSYRRDRVTGRFATLVWLSE